MDGPVGNPRRLDALVNLPGAASGAPFEEREPVGVEEHAAPRGKPHVSRGGAVVHHP